MVIIARRILTLTARASRRESWLRAVLIAHQLATLASINAAVARRRPSLLALSAFPPVPWGVSSSGGTPNLSSREFGGHTPNRSRTALQPASEPSHVPLLH